MPSRVEIAAAERLIAQRNAAASIAVLARLAGAVLIALSSDRMLHILAVELRRLAGDAEERRHYLKRRGELEP